MAFNMMNRNQISLLLLVLCSTWPIPITRGRQTNHSPVAEAGFGELVVESEVRETLGKVEAQIDVDTEELELADEEIASMPNMEHDVNPSGDDDVVVRQERPGSERLFIQLLGIEGSGHHLALSIIQELTQLSNGVIARMPNYRTGSPEHFREILDNAGDQRIYIFRPSYPSNGVHWVPNATLIMDVAHEAGWNYLGLGLYRDPIMSIASALRRFDWDIRKYLPKVDECLQILESLCLSHRSNELPWRPNGSLPSTVYQVMHFDVLGAGGDGAVTEQNKVGMLLFSQLSRIIPSLRKEQVTAIVRNAFQQGTSASSFDKEPTSVQDEMQTKRSQHILRKIDSRYGSQSGACILGFSDEGR
eukprot:TRINITY_DN2801_c0_g1_i1.p1 TRINITY_DN2801_c0_g1~~TRINITY_DN2801_c0_g1_i1.p1  ORF type:complete len:360 (-),score=24.67 TRINITY_DN2801_c0_g1_i1:165-1244(-)